MNYKMTGRFLSTTLLLEALFMIPALLISLFSGESISAGSFAITMAIILATAGFLMLLCKGAPTAFGARDGFACVAISWIILSVFGCLPFVFSRQIPNFIDALFETVSGFSTTGASVLADVESLYKGNLYWRSFTHWVGGMGVLVFMLAFTPGSGQGKGFTMHLLRAESPGPNVGKLVPKMRKTASILYLIYICLTVLNVIFLLFGGMDLLEAVCTAFGTVGTGGFGIYNDSLANCSPYIQNVTTVFMLLCGVNFTCYYWLLLREFKSVLKDEELRLYAGIVIAAIVMLVINLRGLYPTLEETVRHAAFQVASIITTTGYSTADFDLWPAFSKGILLALMIIGACAGSTGGGIKVARVLLLFKSLQRNIRQVLRPNKVQMVRNNGQVVEERVLDSTNAYLAAYIIIAIFSYVLISLDGFSIGTNLSAVLACFNNIGPGMEMVGPTCNYAIFSPLSKLVLIIDMLAGRLEIFPILIFLSRGTWKHQ